MSQLQQSLWLSKPLPRYTSYPPAPFFHAGVGRVDYENALAGIGAEQAVSLYLHIPFCRSLCLYCGCHTAITNRQDRINNYLDALRAELKLVQTHLKRKQPVSRIHFGGGTPNILTAKQFTQLMRDINECFALNQNTEIAIECDPRVLTEEFVVALAANGVKRASLGVQDVDMDVQAAIGREQSFEQVAQSVAWFRKHGINRINLDLIYGLPRQTVAGVTQTAETCLALKPDRIALFSYAHVPQIKPQQKVLEIHGLPDKADALQLEQAMRDVLVGAGYKEVGMDHFALPDDALTRSMENGTLHRNFQGYTDDTSNVLIGFGASSLSQIEGNFFQNEKDISKFQQCIFQGKLATIRGYHSDEDDKGRAALIEKLMCALKVDVGAHMVEEIKALQPFIETGVASWNNGVLSLTAPQRMAVRALAHVFDKHSRARAQVYSKAS